VDSARSGEDTEAVSPPGRSRERLAVRLNAAFGEGLLSEFTLSHRLGLLFGRPLVDPQRLVGDLHLGAQPRSGRSSVFALAASLRGRLRDHIDRDRATSPLLLALDWSAGPHEDLLVGRDARTCDVVLGDRTVSRRHARLRHGDGAWIIQDLRSTNGVSVNGEAVGRCRLRPGDQLTLGGQRLEVD
jgi:hypothetical protein